MGRLGRDKILDIISTTVREQEPDAQIILYGSRARGDWNENSDWDLLILLDKPKRDSKDWENYAWPFTEMGWDVNEDISARTFTKNDWFNGPHTMFFFNVEEDKEILYES